VNDGKHIAITNNTNLICVPVDHIHSTHAIIMRVTSNRLLPHFRNRWRNYHVGHSYNLHTDATRGCRRCGFGGGGPTLGQTRKLDGIAWKLKT
jgi:hypothetical protein